MESLALSLLFLVYRTASRIIGVFFLTMLVVIVPWSATWSFTTVPAIADVPTLTAPTNTATDIPLDGTLEWNMVTGADTYSIEIATDATFSTIIDSQSGLTDPTTIAAGLLNNQTYYWHVRSHNAGGDSAWSFPWSFTTVPAVADAPILTAPIG